MSKNVFGARETQRLWRMRVACWISMATRASTARARVCVCVWGGVPPPTHRNM